MSKLTVAALQLGFTDDTDDNIRNVSALVREQRNAVALTPSGPWWRLLLTVTNHGETTVNYDHGHGPFPHDQLLAPEHYQNDLEAYPRPRVPAWLARYIEGPGERRTS